VPTHGDARAATVAELRPDQRWRPLVRLHLGQAAELLAEHALLEGQLIGMTHVLDAAAAAGARMGAGLLASFGAGADDPLAAGLDHLTARSQHPGLDLLAGQGAADE